MKLNVLTKILTPGIIATAFLIGILFYTSTSMQSLVAEYDDAMDRDDLVADSLQIQVQAERVSSQARAYLLAADGQFLQGYIEAKDGVNKRLQAMHAALTADETGRNQLAEIERTWQDYVAAADREVAFMKGGDQKSAVQVMNTDGTAAKIGLDATIATFLHRQNTLAEKQKTTAHHQTATARLIGIGLAGVAAAVSLLLALLIGLSVSRPVVAVAQAAQRLAGGDLTVSELKNSSKDEIGNLARSFNTMRSSLHGLITEVAGSAATVAASARELTAATEQVTQTAQGVAQAITEVARGTTGQSEAVRATGQIVAELQSAIGQIAAGAQNQAQDAQSTSAIMAKMAAAIDDVVAKAGGVSASSQRATETAAAGQRVVEQTRAGMDRIRTSVQTSARQVTELGRLSGQIGDITLAITELADQTNLLALNAAIEAARAGEHGRGFAVVADEVRKLAERSSKSAGEIADLIHRIQDGTATVVKAMEQGTAAVSDGVRLADDAGRVLQEITGVTGQAMADARRIADAARAIADSSREVVGSANSVAAISEENTAATEQMAAGSDAVMESVASVAATAEGNAASSEEVSAAVEELNATMEEIAASSQGLMTIATTLQQLVGRFTL
ncbi:MAG TPA: methyl-accepting chemotaxis protein [Symbiobacteriaceae bacterium]|jgi:methyl-accepting chemotaxis protein